MALTPIPEIVAELAAGHMVVLVDEEDRENEGDLVLAAQFVTPEAINFMARYGRGLVCLTVTEERARLLNLPPMANHNQSAHGTNFTVSIEAASGVTTGISAADRARTVKAAVAKNARASDIVQPGHIFPIVAQTGGVLVRAGHTEAGCDLTQMAGLMPAAVICEILNEDGSMARLPDLTVFAQQHGMKIGAIADLIHYRAQTERLVERIGKRPVTTARGKFEMIVFRDKLTDATHLALVKGTIDAECETLVRVHEPLSAIDILDADARSHSWSIDAALSALQAAERGVMVLLHRPESAADLRRRALSIEPARPAKMDLRNYGIGSQILRDLGVGKMRLLAQPRKMPSMSGFDLEITGFVSPGKPEARTANLAALAK